MKRVAVALLSTWLSVSAPSQAQDIAVALSSVSALSSGQAPCSEDIQVLTERLLQDLPGYANRVIQRAALLSEPAEMDVYVIVAGQPEFEPLSLGPGQYRDTEVDPNPPQQVFFTTLERQYLQDRVLTVQNYHWLFLTRTSGGWRMAMIYTRLGSPTDIIPPRPPLETSDSIIGQSVALWLRDCRAGTTRSTK